MDHLPIDSMIETLSFYVMWLSHHIEPQSMDTYLSGIANRLEDTYPARLSKLVQHKLPLSLHNLVCVHATLRDDGEHDDCLFLALLFTGFMILQRLGELTWPDASQHQSYRKVALCHTVSLILALWLTSAGKITTHSWFLWQLHKHCRLQMSVHSMHAEGTTTLAIIGIMLDLI
ncbi:hypothetical protein BDR06DRAFT_985580 [Suillus hirtellus]|nr:hypothetical protein BDR06DRAFT_985580 [Suillus hirtellus]